MIYNSVFSKSIEWLRFICAVLVVLLHAGELAPYGYDNSDFPYRFVTFDFIKTFFSHGLCLVAVPVFFIISGYLFFLKIEQWNYFIWKSKLLKRISSLFIPYIIWNIIPLIYNFIVHCLKLLFIDKTDFDVTSVNEWFDSIGGWLFFWDDGSGFPFNTPMWFVRDLMVLVVISPIIFHFIRFCGKLGVGILFFTCMLNLIPEIPGFGMKGLFFFTFGAFLSINRYDFVVFFKKQRLWAMIISTVLVFYISIIYSNNRELYYYAAKLFELAGSIFLVGFIASIIEKKKYTIASYLSNSSFLIYASHGPIVVFTIAFVMREILPNDKEFVWIIAYFFLALSTVFVILVIYVVLSKWFPRTLSVITGNRGGC